MPVATRQVYFGGSFVETPLYDRAALGAEAEINGPAIVQQADTTIVIDPGARGRVDALGNLVINVNPASH
jgi:N-methylhydantoinase A